MTNAVRSLSERAYWASQALQGKQAIRLRLRCLEESQWSAPEEIRSAQLAKLRRLVAHCYYNVPYYRQVMDRAGIAPADIVDHHSFAALPRLTRDDLHERGRDLIARTADPALLQARHSSGSTGVRVEIYQDQDFDLWCRAHQLRTYAWCGSWRLGDRFALVWGAPVLFETRTRNQRVDNLLSRRIELDAFRLDRRSLDRMLDALLRAQPRLISGYTTALYLLAQRALERGVRIAKLAAVQATAEPIAAEMRGVIAAGFGCEVFDKYGSRETSIVAHESPTHAGMCIQAEHTYVEFLDANDVPCENGQPGRLIVTTLNNYAQPLLRYETSDVAAPLDGACPSGIGLPLMTPVSGRLHDVICGGHGELVHPQLFSNVIRQFAHVRWFQAIQREHKRLTLRVVTDGGAPLSDPVRATISGLIRQRSGVDFAIDYEALADMPEPSTATGKYRLCVSTLPIGERGGLNALRAGEHSHAGLESERTESI